MDPAGRENPGPNDSQHQKSGNILYSDGAKAVPTESDWVRLLRRIEADDPAALHTLYRLSHRIVFTLIFRITNDWEAAEEQTIEVFQDIRRDPWAYDPSHGSVVGWIANKARVAAFRGRSTADPKTLYNLPDESMFPRAVLSELTTEELQVIEAAFFADSNCEDVAEKVKVPPETVKARIREGLGKIRRALGNTTGMSAVHSPLHLDSVYLYLLQALSPNETLPVEWQIFTCEDCIREVSSLRPVIQSLVSWQTDLLRPASSLWPRVAQKIGEDTRNQPILAPVDLGITPFWEDVSSGISCKVLATDAGNSRVSMLVRMNPETGYPPHCHADVEECYLLHGELMVNEKMIYPGDYYRAEAGSIDHRVWTQTGCSCVLLTSTRNIML